MDETQKRKISAKEFIEKNRKVGYGLLGLFLSLFIIYFAFVYFYSRSDNTTTLQQNISDTSSTTSVSDFVGSLLPTFNISDQKDPELDNDFLNNFNNPNITKDAGSAADDQTKLFKIENDPVLGYTVFDKPISIKNYIKNKPKICSQKLEVVTKKEEKSPAVANFQALLKNTDGYETTPETGILDQATRDQIYIFQKRYADILYKNKDDKTPTRLIDKETVHFLNLLCGFDTENKDDFVQVPTLRYVTKENRQIFDYNTDSKEKKEVEAKVASGTEDVVFSKKGDYAVFRRSLVGGIDSIFYDIRTKSVTHLENNITTLDFDSKDNLYYGVPGSQGITIKSFDHLHNSVHRVATLPLNEWSIKMLSDTEMGINSKPSAFADGIFMSLNLSTNKLRQLAGPLLGLSIQSTNYPDFSIVSVGGQGNIKTLLLNNKTRNVGDLGIRTFAEKCSQNIFAEGIFCAVPKTLQQGFVYPDDWYKGKMYTEDLLVYKSISGTTTKVISYLENRPLSIVNLNITKNGIFFIDENTYSLYSLEL